MSSHYFSKKHSYKWSGTTPQGSKVSGEINAFSINLAKFYLKQQSIKINSIHKKRFLFLTHIKKRISHFDIAIFFRQLATLIGAGIPIVQSCHILSQTQNNPSFQSLINSIKHEIESGNGFAQGLRKFPRYFNPMICHLIEMGEQTGTLDKSLTRVAQYQEKRLALKKQLIQALIYPGITTLIALIVTTIMLTCIVPRFAELFQTMHSKLPAFTMGVITISDLMRQYHWVMVFPIITGIFLIYQGNKSVAVQTRLDSIILKLPIIGKTLKKIILIRFARNLAATFAAGIPIMESLRIIANATGNNIYKLAILRLQADVVIGKQLHTAIEDNALFPPLMVQLIKVGEETGMLEQMLEKIASVYDADVDHLMTNLNQLLEPLIILILGVLIGGLVIAMYLPIFKLGTVI